MNKDKIPYCKDCINRSAYIWTTYSHKYVGGTCKRAFDLLPPDEEGMWEVKDLCCDSCRKKGGICEGGKLFEQKKPWWRFWV